MVGWRLEPEVTKNIFVRKAQWQAAGESERAIHLVQGFVRGKLKNYRHLLLRRSRLGKLIKPDQDKNAIL